ncbi:major facilitator superfamily transporter [Polyplosphaeria fusca]|uniref:Major facilitator superfamily transporter n=1 Tax=Polyplosphaeria fusca TaxID=682080 RepID=A0A9P4QL10_9PLEO|nr:major facilitator superfamily transporter [Polyplosphaeria fusca]
MPDLENNPSNPYSDDELEKLGRQRPSIFKNTWSEIGFCACILSASILAEFLISGFNVLLPNVIEDLGIDPAKRTWPANVFSLVTGALLLPAGRLADIHGGFIVFMFGLVWMTVWSLFTGFSRNYLMLVFGRALQGIGAAAFLPSGIMLLASTYRPGPRKNLVFGIYGACAPFGFFFGIAMAGVTGQYLMWPWFFWIGTILMSVAILGTWFLVPHKRASSEELEMDWLGTATSVSALILLVYGITNSSHLGWTSAAILAPFLVGILMLISFVYVEWRVAKHPILPSTIFAQKGMTPLALCMFLCFGSFGIFLFYAAFYERYTLMCEHCLGFLRYLLAVLSSAPSAVWSCICYPALSSYGPNYWAWIMPAMLCATIGVDIMFNVSNIYLTTNIPQNQQGLAGAFINGVLFLGMSFVLGFADYGVSQKANLGLKGSYNVGFWLGVGTAVLSILLVLFCIRIGKASSELTGAETSIRHRESICKKI